MTIAAQTIGSVAVLLMWLRQLRLLMIVSSDMGAPHATAAPTTRAEPSWAALRRGAPPLTRARLPPPPAAAPLVRMMGGMLNDVLMFLQLLLLVLFGFAGALSTLYK